MRIAARLLLSGALAMGVLTASAQQGSTPDAPAINMGGAAVHRLELGDSVAIGQPMHSVDPVVPKKLGKKEFVVVLHGTIGIDGSFKDLVMVSGDPAVKNAVLDAVQQWLYSPCTLNGAPIETPVYIALSFDKEGGMSRVEADPPFPTGPKKTTQEQIAAGEILHIGKEVPAPKAVYAPDPEYSEIARIAKFSGSVVVSLIVGADGNPSDVWIKQKIGLGLDQKAIQTVQRWKFKPAMKDGHPIAIPINVEVTFHIY